MTIPFDEWQKSFKDTHKELFDYLEDKTRFDREIKEADEPEAFTSEELQYYILMACNNAINYENFSKKLRTKETDAYTAIEGKGKNAIDALKNVKDFCRNHPDAAQSIAMEFYAERYNKTPQLYAEFEPLELLNLELGRLKLCFENYAEKAHKHEHYPVLHGPLIIPKAENQQNIKELQRPKIDGLIFELTHLIHVYLKRISKYDPIAEIPEGSRLKDCNDIVAKFVNAALNTKLTPEQVKGRLDSLKKVGAKMSLWDQLRSFPEARATGKTKETPYIAPRLFEK